MREEQFADTESWLKTVDFEKGRKWLNQKPRTLMLNYNNERNDGRADVRLNHNGICQEILIPIPRPNRDKRRNRENG